jgi:transcriptional regulator with XRE-family HTH domain
MFDLKGFRKSRKLSQKQISEILGIGTSFISQIETGKDPMPSYVPEKLAAAFGKEEVDVYFVDATPAELEAERRYWKQFAPPKGIGGDFTMPEDTEKVSAERIDRLLRALERRDELAMLQQREYERQGARIDEIVAFLKWMKGL